jgi:hypothetical protein
MTDLEHTDTILALKPGDFVRVRHGWTRGFVSLERVFLSVGDTLRIHEVYEHRIEAISVKGAQVLTFDRPDMLHLEPVVTNGCAMMLTESYSGDTTQEVTGYGK